MKQITTARRSLIIAFGMTALIGVTGITAQARTSKHTSGKAVQLVGKLMGVPARQTSLPDTGSEYRLSGNGDVQPLGSVTLTGDLHTPPVITPGRTTGTLKLTGPQGSLSLTLSGSGHDGFSTASSSLTFTITGGTGRYTGAHGSGSATLTMTAQQRPPRTPGRPMPMYIRAATFTLLLYGKPVR